MTLIYDYMMQNSSSEKALDYFRFDVPRDVEYISIWRGFLRNIADELDIKKHLVDQAMQQLFYVESVRRMYKGSNGHPSIFYLIEPPEQNKFMQMQEKNHITGRFHTLTPEQRAQDSINRLTNRVIALEEKIERLERLVSSNDALRYPRRRY